MLLPRCRCIAPRLVRSYNTVRAITISTLDLARQSDSDFVDIGSCWNPAIRTQECRPDGRPTRLLYKYRTSFPSHARGFLYYNSPTHLPPTAGAIRLRLQGTHQSQDLLLPNGFPWSIPVWRLRHYEQLQKLLLKDGLINHSLLNHCATIFPDDILEPSFFNFHSVIHGLGQTFPIRVVDRQRLRLWIVGPKEVSPVVFNYHIALRSFTPYIDQPRTHQSLQRYYGHLRLEHYSDNKPFYTCLTGVFDSNNSSLLPVSHSPKDLLNFKGEDEQGVYSKLSMLLPTPSSEDVVEVSGELYFCRMHQSNK